MAWGYVFRAMYLSGIIDREINSERDYLSTICVGDQTVWLVTSVIQPRKKPFSYTKNRSVFTDELRFIQTKETVTSIKEKSKQAIIVVIEGSKYPRIREIVEEGVFVHQIKSRILKFIVNGPYKGLGEAVMLMILQPETKIKTYVKKISGRYILSQEIESRPILYREQSGSAISISYGMTIEVFIKWQRYLESSLSAMSRGISMEQILYNFARENAYSGSALLGVSGRTAVTGGEINV